MYNKKVLKKITSSLDKAKKPAAPKDIIVDPKGQWNHPGEVTRIPASNITMQGVNYPVMGVPNIGMPVMMYPGQDYDFPNADYVDEYPQMQDGGYTDAMNGMMKARLAYANEFGNPAAQRMINLPDNPYQFDNGDTGTHYMASMDNYAVPQIQDEDGQLMLGDYGPESDEAMRFESDEDADYFAKHYKDVSPGFMEMELSPEEIQEYAKGGYIIEDVSVPELTKAPEGMAVNPLPLPTPAMRRDSLIIEQAFKKADPFKRAYLTAPKKDGKTNINLLNKYVNAILSDKALIGARGRLSEINKEDPLKIVKVKGYNPENPSLKVQGAFTFKPFIVPPPPPPDPPIPDKKDKKEDKKKEAVIVPSVVPAQQTVSNLPDFNGLIEGPHPDKNTDPRLKHIGTENVTELVDPEKPYGPTRSVEKHYYKRINEEESKQPTVPTQPVVQPPSGRIIRKPGDPKYVGPATTTSVAYPKTPMPYNNALHKNGGELTKAQDGLTKKSLAIADPKEYAYRKKAYDDSLNLYNFTNNRNLEAISQGAKLKEINDPEIKRFLKESAGLGVARVLNANPNIRPNKFYDYIYPNGEFGWGSMSYEKPKQPIVKIIRKPGDPKYVPYKENGGTLNQAQKGKTVKPLEITDPKEFKYRNKMYADSLNLYKENAKWQPIRDAEIKKAVDWAINKNTIKKENVNKIITDNKSKTIKIPTTSYIPLQNDKTLTEANVWNKVNKKIKPTNVGRVYASDKNGNVLVDKNKTPFIFEYPVYKKPMQPVVFKNQIVPTVEQMVTPAKVVQPAQKKVVQPVVQPKPTTPSKITAYKSQTVMYPDGSYELRRVPYYEGNDKGTWTQGTKLNPPGVINAVDLTPEEVNLLKNKNKLNSKEEGGALLKAQDGKTVKHTDKKGNTTITVTDDDGTQYIKVKTADGKVYNKTIPAMKPMSRDEFMQTDYYNQRNQFPVMNQKSETLQNSVNQKATLPQEIENKKDMLGDLQREREAFAVRQSKDQISKGKAPRAAQDWKDKVTDIAFNPMTAAGHWMRGQEVPDYLQESLDNGTYGYWSNGVWHTERNPLDAVTDITPIGGVHSAKNIVDKATDDVDGNFWTYNTLLDAANIIPTAKLIKGFKVKNIEGPSGTMFPPLAPPNISRLPINSNRAIDLGSDIMQPFKPKNIGVDVLDNTTRNLEPIVNTEGKIIRQLGDPKYTEEGLKRFIGNTGVTAKTAAQSDELDLSDLFDDFDESEMARIFGERPLNQSNIPAYQRRTITDFSNPEFMGIQGRRGSLVDAAASPDYLRSIRENPVITWDEYEASPAFNWNDVVNKVNRSGLSKDEILAKASKKDKDILSKMSEDEFIETVLKPTGEIAKYKPSLTVDELMYDTDLGRMRLKNEKPLSAIEYTQEFNKNLDELNKIIAKNNKSGVEYKVKKLDPGGNLIFETPKQTIKGWKDDPFSTTTRKQLEGLLNDPVQLKNSGYTKKELVEMMHSLREDKVIPAGESRWGVYIRPGKWTGKVEDIANEEYFKNIPGINMSNTSTGVFSDRVTRRGTGTYESINEYLKKFDLGRVKPGFNSQTATSKGLWENAVQKDKAFGYYGRPNTVYGSMKSMLPYLVPTAIGAGAAAMERDKFKKGGHVNDEMELDLSPEEIKEYISKGYVIEQVH